MTRLAILLALVLLLVLPAPVLAAEDGNGTIQGSLINGTEGGSSVAEQTVNLKVFVNDTEKETLTTVSDAEGNFTFTGLATGSGYGYQAQLFYQTAEYTSQQVSFSANETALSIKLTVYDATDSNEAIYVATAHSLVYLGQGSLQVNEFYLVVNDSDRAYIGSREVVPGAKETMFFSIPAGAAGFEPGFGLMTCCIYTTEAGLIDTMAILPGEKEVSFSYIVNYSDGQYTFNYQPSLPTNRYDLLVEGEGIKVDSDQLISGEPIEMNGLLFNHLSRMNLNAGENLAIQISGLPQPSSTGNTALLVILVLVILGAGFGFLYLTKRGQNQPVAIPAASNAADLARQQQILLSELAQLDDDFEAGKISQDKYQKQRATRKARLIELEQTSSRR